MGLSICKLVLLFLAVTALSSCQTAASYARQGDYHYSYADYNQAASYYQKASAIKMRHRYQYNLAISYIELEQYSLAISILDGLLTKQPDNVLLMQSLAYGYDKNGDDDAALTLYDALLAINMMDSGAVRGRALILYKREQAALALSELKDFYRRSANQMIQKTIALIYVLSKNDAMALQWLDNDRDQLANLKATIDQ